MEGNRVANNNNDNDIDNVIVSSRTNYNDIDNDRVKYDRSKQVEVVADAIVAKLGIEADWRPYACKVAWKLSEARIWSNVEAALRGREPAKLFVYLCKRDGV